MPIKQINSKQHNKNNHQTSIKITLNNNRIKLSKQIIKVIQVIQIMNNRNNIIVTKDKWVGIINCKLPTTLRFY
jgi:hypothetical protein